MAQDSKNLIPFVEYDSNNEKKWGYLDKETGKKIIEAKYASADFFVGNYALARMEGHNSQIVIDKNDKVIATPPFDYIYLIASENGKNTLAVLKRIFTRTKFRIGGTFLGVSVKGGFYKEEYYKARLFNLATGRTIISEKENYIDSKIEAAGDYFIIENDLYQFLDNGNVKRVVKGNAERSARILADYFETRGINARVNYRNGVMSVDYYPDKYGKPDLTTALSLLASQFTVPVSRIERFYRDPRIYLNTPLPLKTDEKKYLVYFRDEKTGEEAVGIYNETNVKWELFPEFAIMFPDTRIEHFNVVYIEQTADPHLYFLRFKNEAMGWHSWKSGTLGSSVYSTAEGDFAIDVFTFDQAIFQSDWDKEGRNEIPVRGAYYFDYTQTGN